jgi:hypothetical protein
LERRLLHWRAEDRMSRPNRLLLATFFGVLFHTAFATNSPAAETHRIRTTDPMLRDLLAQTAAKSPAMAALQQRLRRSDVVLYVHCDDSLLGLGKLRGETTILSATPDNRFLKSRIKCRVLESSLMLVLAHELRHAVEIADAPEVVDAESLLAFYARIGREIQTTSCCTRRFETAAALQTEDVVRRELGQPSESGETIVASHAEAPPVAP